jgi:hypothetical protein
MKFNVTVEVSGDYAYRVPPELETALAAQMRAHCEAYGLRNVDVRIAVEEIQE